MKTRILILFALLYSAVSFGQYEVTIEGNGKIFTMADSQHTYKHPAVSIAAEAVEPDGTVKITITNGYRSGTPFGPQTTGYLYSELTTGETPFSSIEEALKWFRDYTGASVNEGNGNAPGLAANVTYDPTTSGLSATDVQDAIDEVVATGGGIADGSITAAKLHADVVSDIDGKLESGDNISELVNDSGYITDYAVTEADVTQHQDVIQIDASQVDNLPSGGGADLSLLTEDAYNALTPTAQTNYRGYKTKTFEEVNFYPTSLESVDDSGTLNAAWTVLGGTFEVETVDTRNSPNALKVTGDGTNTTLGTIVVPVEPDTDYTYSYSIKNSSWVKHGLSIRGTEIVGSTIYTVTTVDGEWSDQTISFKTDSDTTEITMTLSSSTAHASQYGIYDNIQLTKAVTIPEEFEDGAFYGKSIKTGDTQELANLNRSSNIYSPTAQTFFESNNLESQMKQISDNIEIIKKTSGHYQIYKDGNDWYGKNLSANYSINSTDPAAVINSIVASEITANHDNVGNFGAFIEIIGDEKLDFRGPIVVKGPYPNNTSANVSFFKLFSKDRGRVRFADYDTPEGDRTGFLITDGMRFAFENLDIGSIKGTEYLLKLDAEGTSKMTARDSYIHNVTFTGSSDSTIVQMENFFKVPLTEVRIRNYGKNALRLRNVGDNVNFGNTVNGFISLATGGDEDATAFTIDRVGTKTMNLHKFEKIEVGSMVAGNFDGYTGASDATAIRLENTGQLHLGNVTAEYVPRGLVVANAGLVTIDQVLMTLQSGPTVLQAKAMDLKNISSFTINGGRIFAKPDDWAGLDVIPLTVDNSERYGQQGNNIRFQVRNGINPETNTSIVSDDNSEYDIWENGTINRFFQRPLNKPFNTAPLDTSSMSSAFSSDETIEEALETAYNKILSGTTAERPSSPSVGDMYYDNSLKKMIRFDGSIWTDMFGINADLASIIEITTTTHELSEEDNGKVLLFNNIDEITISKPPTPFTQDMEFTIGQYNTGKVGTDFQVARSANIDIYARTSYEGEYMTLIYDLVNDEYKVIGGEAYVYETLGDELLTEPNFENDGSSITVAGDNGTTHVITVSGGKLTFLSATQSPLMQFEESDVLLTDGTTYQVTVTVDATRGAKGLRCAMFTSYTDPDGNPQTGLWNVPNEVGTYTITNALPNKTDLEFTRAGDDVDIDITSWSLKAEL